MDIEKPSDIPNSPPKIIIKNKKQKQNQTTGQTEISPRRTASCRDVSMQERNSTHDDTKRRKNTGKALKLDGRKEINHLLYKKWK